MIVQSSLRFAMCLPFRTLLISLVPKLVFLNHCIHHMILYHRIEQNLSSDALIKILVGFLCLR